MGLPGLRGSDHIGFTVPDLDEAEAFLVGVLGAVPVYTLPGRSGEGDWMTRQLGVTRGRRSERSASTASATARTSRSSRTTPPTDRLLPRATATSAGHTSRSTSTTWMPRRPPARPWRRRHGRTGRQRRRVGGAALDLLPRPVGHAVRARQLPRRQGLRERRRDAAVAPREARRMSGPLAVARDHGRAGSGIADTLRDEILRGIHPPGPGSDRKTSRPGTRRAASRCARRCGSSRPRDS